MIGKTCLGFAVAAALFGVGRCDELITSGSMSMCAFGSKVGLSYEQKVDACTLAIKAGRSPQWIALAYEGRATAYMQMNKYDAALADLDHALNFRPLPVEIESGLFSARATAYEGLNQYDAALADAEQALKLRPDNVHMIFDRGLAYRAMHNYAKAIEDYDRVIKLTPTDAEAFDDRCDARATWGQELDTALADCNQALKLEPGSAEHLATRGYTYLQMGQNDKALADFNAALAKDPKESSSLYGRSLIERHNGDEAHAAADIAAAKTIDPDVEKISEHYKVK